jgi:hypothetical protein
VIQIAVGDFNGDGVPDLAVLKRAIFVPISIMDVSILVGRRP